MDEELEISIELGSLDLSDLSSRHSSLGDEKSES